MSVILHDRGWCAKGQFYAFPSDWSQLVKATLKQGKDYRDDTTIDPTTFPNGTKLAYLWPNDGATKPRGFNQIAFGDYRAPGYTPKPVPSRQVKAITALTVSMDLELHGDRAQFNLLVETFLTKKTGSSGGDVLEVGFLTNLSASGRKFFNLSKQIGTFVDASKRLWSVSINGQYAMFIAADGKPCVVADLDFLAAFKFLVGKKLLTGDEWFNGLALGIEPINDSGYTLVNKLSVDYR